MRTDEFLAIPKFHTHEYGWKEERGKRDTPSIQAAARFRHRPYLITTVTNRPSAQPSTWETTTWTYDVKKRVTSAERSPGGERWEYGYDDQGNKVTVEGPSLPKVTYGFQRDADGVSRLFSVDGNPVNPVLNLAPKGQSVGIGMQSGSKVCYEDCQAEIRACHSLCSNAAFDPDMPNIWWGRYGKCMRGCVSQNCGGNKV